MSLKPIFALNLFFLLISGKSFGFHIGSIDFGEIKTSIEDINSEYYYPALLRRIWADDTTMNLMHYKYLYYGNVFQPYYHPYGSSEAKKEFNILYGKKSYKPAIEQGKKVLNENPVDIEVTLKMIYSFLELKDTSMAKIYGYKYFSFLDVIYSSGNGKSPETAFVVISVDDEYRIVGDLLLNVKQQYLINDCDLLIFDKVSQRKVRKKKIKKLYFNVQVPLMSLSDSFKDIDRPDPDEDEDEDEDERENEND